MNSLLPPNATDGEQAIEASTARIADVPVTIDNLWNPQTCPESMLPWLAWGLSIDAWKSYWPIEVKRARIAAAIEIQRHKGTAKSLHEVTASFGGAVELTEWWQKVPRGIPHTFDMVLALTGQGGNDATAEYVDDVIGEIERTKPVRSHFTFTQGVVASGSICVAAYARPVVYRRLQLTADAA